MNASATKIRRARAEKRSRARLRHARMVDDPRRSAPLLRAVAKAVRPGDVVLDIGTGLGVLAIAAARAGAAEVWAVDCDGEALEEATRRARRAKAEEKIRFVEGLSFDLDLPQRADILLCETVGSFAFDENILATIADAKRRLLRAAGHVIPSRLELWGTPSSRLPQLRGPADTARIRRGDLLARPSCLASLDLSGFVPPELRLKHQFHIGRAGVVRAIALWPRITWWGKELTDASPLAPPTHWKQGILPIEERPVRAGEEAPFEFIIRPHPEDPLRMTERLWRWMDGRRAAE